MCISTLTCTVLQEEQLINVIDYLKLLTHFFCSESACVLRPLNTKKQTTLLALDQLFFGLLRCHFLLPKDSPWPHLILRCAQVGAGSFAFNTMRALGVKMTLALCCVTLCTKPKIEPYMLGRSVEVILSNGDIEKYEILSSCCRVLVWASTYKT